MIFNYELAGRWKDVVRAIFMIESNENMDSVGDGSRAYGAGQMYPAFFAEMYGACHAFPRDVHDTWADAQIKAAASYFELWQGLERDLLIQGYNVGISGVIRSVEPLRNPDYLVRFTLAFGRIHGAWPERA